tara:strand:+ start:117 stop:626 length:510 start_codon:yes stop_codon:yes gene_type:complete
MRKKIFKDKGILFWITGLSGTGKSSIGNAIYKKISNIYGPTIIIHGDDFRKIWEFNSYSNTSRYRNCVKYARFCKYVTDQNINIIFTVIGMFKKIRNWNKKNIKNYMEIYIENDDYKNNNNRKKFKKNVVGIDLKAELPSKPDIKISNNFKKNIKFVSNQLIKDIKKII